MLTGIKDLLVYGMVNKAIEDLVCMEHGEPMWEKIKERANVDVDVFISNDPYPDDLTYRMVAAAAELLQTPADQILHAFGEHWVLKTAKEGYGGIMQSAGKTLPEFLKNLNNLHTRVIMLFPKLNPPRFECTDVQAQSLKLHYYSERIGLEPFVVGLIVGLGKMFGTPATAVLAQGRDSAAGHDIFEVTWSTP